MVACSRYKYIVFLLASMYFKQACQQKLFLTGLIIFLEAYVSWEFSKLVMSSGQLIKQ